MLNLTSYLQGAGSSTGLGPLRSSEATAGGGPQPNYGDYGDDKLGCLAEHLQQAMRVGQCHSSATHLSYCTSSLNALQTKQCTLMQLCL